MLEHACLFTAKPLGGDAEICVRVRTAKALRGLGMLFRETHPVALHELKASLKVAPDIQKHPPLPHSLRIARKPRVKLAPRQPRPAPALHKFRLGYAARPDFGVPSEGLRGEEARALGNSD